MMEILKLLIGNIHNRVPFLYSRNFEDLYIRTRNLELICFLMNRDNKTLHNYIKAKIEYI